jgi:Transglutaminase-like superfamily
MHVRLGSSPSQSTVFDRDSLTLANLTLFSEMMHMIRAPALMRICRMDAGRRRLLIRAWVVLTMASAAVALLPFRIAIRFGTRSIGAAKHSLADWIGAVETAARYVPWRTMCIEKGLAVQRLMRRSGVDARLHYGARHAAETGKLEAHVWVTVAGEAVFGGEEATGYAELARYP